MTTYFKVQTGFNTDDFISITEDELQKAIYAQITGAVAIFRNGTIRGNNIIGIREDWHKAMGWNYGHKLGADDFAEISAKCQSYVGVIAAAKTQVDEVMRTGQTNLLGTNLPQLTAKA